MNLETLEQYLLMIDRIDAGYESLLAYEMKNGYSKENAVDEIIERLEMCRKRFKDYPFSKSVSKNHFQAKKYIKETAEQIFELIMHKISAEEKGGQK